MKNIQYISAGAGSGKTYFLTHELADLIAGKNGKPGIAPEKVILTTFTRKAAAEIRERAKQVLYEKGMPGEAQRLDLALIGTVHSVAYHIIQKYWYHLGISPDLVEMPEEDVDFYINQSVASLPSAEDMKMFHSFRRFFDVCKFDGGSIKPDHEFWKRHLKDIVSKAVTYDVEDLAYSLDRSLSYVESVCDGSHLPSDADCKKFLSELKVANEAAKPSSARDDRIDTINRLIGANSFVMKDYLFLLSSPASVLKNCPSVSSMEIQLRGAYQSVDVRDKVKEYVETIFSLAGKWREEYREYKRVHRLIDFNDMEQYLLELLKVEEVRDDIRSRYEYLFVDEFQDSSPAQVKIFEQLSSLCSQSYWVGDAKQAIFGFRGSDTVLTSTVANIISRGKDGCSSRTLDTSYRSTRNIVDLTNEVFDKVFSSTNPPLDVRLNHHRKEKGDLRVLYNPEVGKNEDLAYCVANAIALRLKSGAKPSDIAVLCRSNDELKPFVSAFLEMDIPISIEKEKEGGDREKTLLFSLLSLIVNPRDSLARATIDYMTRNGATTSDIIDRKLKYDDDRRKASKDSNQDEGNDDEKDIAKKDAGFLGDNPLIGRLLSQRDSLKNLSVKSVVESVVIGMDLVGEAHKWDPSRKCASIYEALIAKAAQYEDHCLALAKPATLSGFITYADTFAFSGISSPDGVTLSTYHKSKGLEWNTVYLMSLEDDQLNHLVNGSFFGVEAFYEDDPSEDNLYPKKIITLNPWIFGKAKKLPDYVDATMKATPHYGKLRTNTLEESKRLLYVGVTRARDTLVLCLFKKKDQLKWFNQIGVDNTSTEGDCLGVGMEFTPEPYELDSAYFYGSDPLEGKVLAIKKDPVEYEPRDVSPSTLIEKGEKADVEVAHSAGYTIHIRGKDEMSEVGTCIHNIYCSLEFANDKIEYVKNMLEDGGWSGTLDASEIVKAWDNLEQFLSHKYGPSVSRHHELPFKYVDGGQIFTGSMDFVYETEDGVVLVDYKTFPGSIESVTSRENTHYAGLYKGQFDCYASALQKAGKKVVDRLVYYPVNGLVVRLK